MVPGSEAADWRARARSRSHSATRPPPAAIRAAQAELYRLYEAGAIKPLIGERVPMVDAPAAMDRVASRGSVGKVILVP